MGRTDRWGARPVVAWSLRVVALAGPLLVALLAGVGMQRLLGPSADPPGFVVSFLLTASASALAAWGAERVTRRLLPLAWLCRLTLIFPDRAPSRFAVALRASSSRRIRDAAPGESASAAMALALALAAHDRRTRGHSDRVRALCAMLGDELGLDETDKLQLCWAGLLHDIGKLEVPTAIINKPGPLTEAERDLMRQHPGAGARLAAPLREFLGPAAAAISQHHERWDGTGYPFSMRGPNIALSARIVSIADSFETMTAARAYKRPMRVGAARAEVSRCAGSHFDPDLVRVFLGISLPRLAFAVGPAAVLAQVPLLGQLLRLPAPAAPSLLQQGAALIAAPAVALGTVGLSPPPGTTQPAAVALAPASSATSSPTAPSTAAPAPTAAVRPSVLTTTPPRQPAAELPPVPVGGSDSPTPAPANPARRVLGSLLETADAAVAPVTAAVPVLEVVDSTTEAVDQVVAIVVSPLGGLGA